MIFVSKMKLKKSGISNKNERLNGIIFYII